jgi:hypothetical protein
MPTFSEESRRFQKQIRAIQAQLAKLGPMRPGCLSLQYRNPKDKTGANYQLSYTYQMKSKTEYIPADLVPQIQEEVAEYKRFRELTAEWIALSIQWSQLKIKESRAAR